MKELIFMQVINRSNDTFLCIQPTVTMKRQKNISSTFQIWMTHIVAFGGLKDLVFASRDSGKIFLDSIDDSVFMVKFKLNKLFLTAIFSGIFSLWFLNSDQPGPTGWKGAETDANRQSVREELPT